MQKELINAKFRPDEDEISYTKAYNDGEDVEPRLAGQSIFYAVQNDIKTANYTPEQYFVRLQNAGLQDGPAKIFVKAYADKNINYAKELINDKVADAYDQKILQNVSQKWIDGDGFAMREGGTTKTDYNVKTDVAPNVRDLAKLTTEEISADLEYLASKHPEMFEKPSDVFRLVKDIKENPEFFYKNNKLDYALMVKRLDGHKIGKLAIVISKAEK